MKDKELKWSNISDTDTRKTGGKFLLRDGNSSLKTI